MYQKSFFNQQNQFTPPKLQQDHRIVVVARNLDWHLMQIIAETRRETRRETNVKSNRGLASQSGTQLRSSCSHIGRKRFSQDGGFKQKLQSGQVSVRSRTAGG